MFNLTSLLMHNLFLSMKAMKNRMPKFLEPEGTTTLEKRTVYLPTFLRFYFTFANFR